MKHTITLRFREPALFDKSYINSSIRPVAYEKVVEMIYEGVEYYDFSGKDNLCSIRFQEHGTTKIDFYNIHSIISIEVIDELEE